MAPRPTLRAGMERLVILGCPAGRVFQVQERSDVVNTSRPQSLHGFPFWTGINLQRTTPADAIGQLPEGRQVPAATRARGRVGAHGTAVKTDTPVHTGMQYTWGMLCSHSTCAGCCGARQEAQRGLGCALPSAPIQPQKARSHPSQPSPTPQCPAPGWVAGGCGAVGLTHSLVCGQIHRDTVGMQQAPDPLGHSYSISELKEDFPLQFFSSSRERVTIGNATCQAPCCWYIPHSTVPRSLLPGTCKGSPWRRDQEEKGTGEKPRAAPAPPHSMEPPRRFEGLEELCDAIKTFLPTKHETPKVYGKPLSSDVCISSGILGAVVQRNQEQESGR